MRRLIRDISTRQVRVSLGMRKRFLCFAALLAAFSTTVWSTPGTWEPIGPEGGSFVGCVANPDDPSQIRAMTSDPATVYESLDRGDTWTKAGELPVSYVNDMCAFGYDRLYAVSWSEICRSTDGGVT